MCNDLTIPFSPRRAAMLDRYTVVDKVRWDGLSSECFGDFIGGFCLSFLNKSLPGLKQLLATVSAPEAKRFWTILASWPYLKFYYMLDAMHVWHGQITDSAEHHTSTSHLLSSFKLDYCLWAKSIPAISFALLHPKLINCNISPHLRVSSQLQRIPTSYQTSRCTHSGTLQLPSTPYSKHVRSFRKLLHRSSSCWKNAAAMNQMVLRGKDQVSHPTCFIPTCETPPPRLSTVFCRFTPTNFSNYSFNKDRD